MTKIIGLTGLALVAGMMALPAFADIDAGMLTCGEYLGMDAAGKNAATNAVSSYVKDAANTATAASAAEIIKDMDDAGVQQALDSDCVGAAPDLKVYMAIKASN